MIRNILSLPLLALVACASAPAQPSARDASTTAATAAVGPVAAPRVAMQAPAMPLPPPPPPKKFLAASDRIPLADVVKAVTPNRLAVVLGPRGEENLADLREEGFRGYTDLFPDKHGGTYEEIGLLPHDVVVVDTDDGEPPLIWLSPTYRHGEQRPGAVIVRWRHKAGTRLFLDWSFVDARCHASLCDAFTIYGATLPKERWDLGDLPLVALDLRGRRQ